MKIAPRTDHGALIVVALAGYHFRPGHTRELSGQRQPVHCLPAAHSTSLLACIWPPEAGELSPRRDRPPGFRIMEKTFLPPGQRLNRRGSDYPHYNGPLRFSRKISDQAKATPNGIDFKPAARPIPIPLDCLAQRVESRTASARKPDRGPATPGEPRPIECRWLVRRSSGKRYSASSSRAELGCGL